MLLLTFCRKTSFIYSCSKVVKKSEKLMIFEIIEKEISGVKLVASIEYSIRINDIFQEIVPLTETNENFEIIKGNMMKIH